MALSKTRERSTRGMTSYAHKPGERFSSRSRLSRLGGRVIVTQNELRAASQYGKDYFLIGFVAEGPEALWRSAVLQNPLSHLLEAGTFDLDVTLQAKATDVFPLSDELSAAPT